MKISIFTTITNPSERGDNYTDALNCYLDFADEVIIVNGGQEVIITARPNDTIVFSEWPKEFDWPLIGEQFQKGYEAATGDWVIHMDLDMLFHEKDFSGIRKKLEDHPALPAMSFYKWQFIQPDRYNLKSWITLAVNKRVHGKHIRFDSGGDLCQPSYDGKFLDPHNVPSVEIPIYNYEKITKNVNQMTEDCGRMDRAYHEHFGKYQLSTDGSGSDESSFDGYIQLLKGRYAKESRQLTIDEHPKYVQETIMNLKPSQFGFDGFGLFDKNNYVGANHA
jgi:hypothetical protein